MKRAGKAIKERWKRYRYNPKIRLEEGKEGGRFRHSDKIMIRQEDRLLKNYMSDAWTETEQAIKKLVRLRRKGEHPTTYVMGVFRDVGLHLRYEARLNRWLRDFLMIQKSRGFRYIEIDMAGNVVPVRSPTRISIDYLLRDSAITAEDSIAKFMEKERKKALHR